MKKLSLILLMFFVFAPHLFSQSDDDPQNTGKSTVKETAKEALGLYVQYRRTINEATKYWEDEIASGLSNGRYINNRTNRQYSRIKNIFDRLLQSQYITADLKKYNWRIYLHNSNEVNAFAALDGIIIINRGIIDFCQDDDELAIVIGHEIAHMKEDHVKKQLATRIVMEPIIDRVSSLIARKKNRELSTEEISDKEISDKELFQFIFGLSGELALLKYSRSQEEKADEIGAMYAANVGYDTDKGYNFWKRMGSISNDNRWTALLSTHPYSERRALAFLNGDYKTKYYRER